MLDDYHISFIDGRFEAYDPEDVPKNAILYEDAVERGIVTKKPRLISIGEFSGEPRDEFHVRHKENYLVTELYYYIEDGMVSWPGSGALFNNPEYYLGHEFRNAFGDASLGLGYEDDAEFIYICNDEEKRYYSIYREDCSYWDALDINCRGQIGPIDPMDEGNY